MRTRVSATGPRSQSHSGSPGRPGGPPTAGSPLGARVRRGSRRRTGPLGPIQTSCGPARVLPHQHTSAAHLRNGGSAPLPPARPFLPRGWLISIPTEGSRPQAAAVPNSRGHFGSSVEPSCSAHRPHQHAYGSQGGDEQSPARVSLEELHLSPSSELQDGPGTEETEPKSPEGTVQGSLGPAEAQESDEQHQKRQQPRTPSPLVLEGATEQGSPPLSPSTKLIDRTESLNRSIRKSNSVKKSQPPLPISKIDERLEQYTQAIETAGRTPKLTRQPSIELPSMAVASTKSRWETGEVQAQSTAKTPSCKDIVAGDMSKKSLWEQKGGSKTSSTIKQSTPSGKRYKFVATGHGKYEKVLVDEGSVP
ncbi:lymphocyte-specific protein 1 isoform X5 [Prionailurus viverrinus]|uniref:lymphocyte-specific protein 1 isoform X5 n=1 Tax=Prionailurus viverrinus TaxID=61388 RepID=UPI001FF259AC|nr:lymphocyte-specific protein 1 isoform X5 [Prionailurus viverrinus]XP_047733495.1 lymphocyte-specific protein 1 isoform X5 [Prionailurus viverrinus]